jgi:hypothetical protein
MEPYQDPAESILRGEPTINDEQRANLFDIFHSTKDEGELARRLQPLAVPDDFKKQLYDAKQGGAITKGEPLDKVTEAINRMKTIDPQVLAMAEAHPNVLKALTGAAGAAEPTGEGKAGAKGKGQGKGAKATPSIQPPRIDGLENYPPIPEGHHRVRASDGGIHDIPAENIDQAREIDPRLQIMNP